MISNTIGKLGFRYCGAYAASTVYELQDVVEYDNSTYIHTAASSTSPAIISSPPPSANWQMLSESTQSISGTIGHLIARDSSTLTTMPSGATGQILTSTSKNIYTRTVTVNSTPQYEFDGAITLPDLVEGDQLILNVTPSIVSGSPIIFGKDSTTFLTSADGIRYIVNDLQFNNADDFARYAKVTSVSSCRIIWDVPEDYTHSSSSTVVWMDYDGSVGGNYTNVYDSGSSPNSIVLKWKDYPNESPRKVARFPDNVHCNTKNFAAFVMMDGSIRTVGTGDTYRHGNGTTDDREQPSLVGLSNTITGVSSLMLSPDSGINYLIDSSGKLWTWGKTSTAETGNSALVKTYSVPEDITSIISSEACSGNPIQVLDVCEVLGTNDTSTNYMSMVRVLEGTTIHLVAVGSNAFGQLGVVNNDITQTQWKKVYPSSFSNPISFAIGTSGDARTFFAIDSIGDVYSWGSNVEGTLGLGGTSDFGTHSTPTKITGLPNPIQKITVGNASAYAIDNTNDLYAWGRNYYGNLGLGDKTDRTSPEFVMENVANVFTNGHTYDVVFVLKTDGTILSCGDGSYGATGQGTTGDLQSFVPVTFENEKPITNVTKVIIGGTASRNSTAVLTSDGSVYTCGYNTNGQLGLGDLSHRSYLEEVPIGKRVIDIQWFGIKEHTVLALLTDEHDVFICGSGIEGLNTEYSGNMRLVPTPIIF